MSATTAKTQVFIPHHGSSDIHLFSKDGLLVAVGYCRVEFGGRGEYVEIDESQIQKTAIHKVTAPHVYFDEYRSNDESNTMVYFQRRTVKYADYRIGFYYVSVLDLIDGERRPIAGNPPGLIDEAETGTIAIATVEKAIDNSNLEISNRAALIQPLMELHKGVTQAYALRDTQRLEAGKILLVLRGTTPHGDWLPQLKEICKAIGMSQSAAYNYMNAAKAGSVPKLKDGDTISGHKMDVIRHIFQTSIRRGNEHRALKCAKELDLSGSTEWIWYRMPIIASEDVGLARLGLQHEIEDLRVQWKRKRNDKRFNSHRLFLTHAVLLLVRAMKSRLTDHALITYYESQQPIEVTEADIAAAGAATDPIQITDDDLDKHTAAGRAMGRTGVAGINHFFDVSAKLVNESPAIEDQYKESARHALLQKVGGG